MPEPDINVVEYNPAWPSLFEEESERVRNVLGDRVMFVEHFGSTAVPGLPAKPIIDFCVVLNDLELASVAIDLLEDEGYRIHNDWEKRTVLRRSTTESHMFNLHLAWQETLPEIRWNLMFRDYLWENPPARERYATVKQEAADKFPNDVKGYYEAKTPVIEEIMERAEGQGYLERIDFSEE